MDEAKKEIMGKSCQKMGESIYKNGISAGRSLDKRSWNEHKACSPDQPIKVTNRKKLFSACVNSKKVWEGFLIFVSRISLQTELLIISKKKETQE